MSPSFRSNEGAAADAAPELAGGVEVSLLQAAAMIPMLTLTTSGLMNLLNIAAPLGQVMPPSYHKSRGAVAHQGHGTS